MMHFSPIIAKEASNKLQLIHSTRVNYVSKLSYFISQQVTRRPLGWFCLIPKTQAKQSSLFYKNFGLPVQINQICDKKTKIPRHL